LASSGGVGSTPAAAGMSSQVSACYEIILGQVQKVRLCPVSNVTGYHTRTEPPVWITDGRGQRSYRRAALWHPARETRWLNLAL